MNWTGAGFAVIVFGLLVFIIVNNRLTKYLDVLNPRQVFTPNNAANGLRFGLPFGLGQYPATALDIYRYFSK